MIYTRFNNPVKIVGYDKNSGSVTAEFPGMPEMETRRYFIYELKADNGIKEIVSACDKATKT